MPTRQHEGVGRRIAGNRVSHEARKDHGILEPVAAHDPASLPVGLSADGHEHEVGAIVPNAGEGLEQWQESLQPRIVGGKQEDRLVCNVEVPPPPLADSGLRLRETTGIDAVGHEADAFSHDTVPGVQVVGHHA